jgi:hypothetical protein
LPVTSPDGAPDPTLGVQPQGEPEPESARALARAIDHEERVERIGASYAAARRAIELARTYAREPGSTGRRERECLEEVTRLRSVIATLRAPTSRVIEGAMPGLRKVEPPGSPTIRRFARSGERR